MASTINSVAAVEVPYIAPTALLPAPELLLERNAKVAVGENVIVTPRGVVVINTRAVTPTDYVGEPYYINGKFYAAKYVGSGYQWQRSDDGFIWTPLTNAPNVSTITGNGALLLAGFLASSDHGNTWQTITPPSGFGQPQIVQNSTALIAAHSTDQKVAMSFNNGATWVVGNLPGKTGAGYSVLDCAYNAGVFMLLFPTANGSMAGELYVAFSFDNGATWDRRSSAGLGFGATFGAFIVVYSPGTWLIGDRSGAFLFRTTFDGATWSSGYGASPMTTVFKLGDTLVADDYWNKTSQRAVDSITTWTSSAQVPRNGAAKKLQTNGVICVATYNRELFISYDKAQSWVSLNYTIQNVPVPPKLSATRKDSRGVYCTALAVGSYAYVLESDNGRDWRAIAPPRALDAEINMALHAVRLHSSAYNCTLYAVNSGKVFDSGVVYVSWDNGNTWAVETVLPANTPTYDVALSGDETCFVWHHYTKGYVSRVRITGYNSIEVVNSATIPSLAVNLNLSQDGGVHPLDGSRFIVDTHTYSGKNRDKYVLYDAATNGVSLVTAADTFGVASNGAFTLLQSAGGAKTTFDGVTFTDVPFPDAGTAYHQQQYTYNNVVSGAHYNGVPVVSWQFFPNWPEPPGQINVYAPSGLVAAFSRDERNPAMQTSLVLNDTFQPGNTFAQLQLTEITVQPEWTFVDVSSDAYDLAANGTAIVGSGWWDTDGAVFSSRDGGKTWTYFYVPNGGIYALTAGPDGTFIGVGEQKVDLENNVWHPVAVKSTDNGLTWSLHYIRNDSDYSYFGAVSYNGAVFAAVDSNMAAVYISADGETWDKKDVAAISENPGFGYLSAAVGSRIFVFGWNDAGRYIYSDDNGSSWTLAFNTSLLKPYPHVFDGVLYCFDDTNYCVWRSADNGATFTSVLDTSFDTGYYGSYWRQCIAKSSDALYIFNTDTYDCYTSSNGTQWTKKSSVRIMPANGGPSVGFSDYIVRGNSDGYGVEYGPTKPTAFWTGFINCEDV